MKIKFLAIYIVVGAAFLIASLWVTLSGGKSAKAIRCKYKLGGIVLTAWAMLSVAGRPEPEDDYLLRSRTPGNGVLFKR